MNKKYKELARKQSWSKAKRKLEKFLLKYFPLDTAWPDRWDMKVYRRCRNAKIISDQLT